MPQMTDSDAAGLIDKAHAHYEAARWDAAGDAYERALARAPRDALAWYRLGNVREEQGRDADAVACFERAVAIDPAHARAWNNLGGALQRLGRAPSAERAYREAVEADASLLEPRLNLGRLAAARGELDLAADCYREALAHHPGNAMLEHLLAAARGENTARAPAGYVAPLFDAQAPAFERHLVEDLGYRVPEALAALVRPAIAAATPPPRVLDLGCGTGLVGAALAGSGAQLEGIDLSPRMLERAAARGVYATLHQGDIPGALGALPATAYAAVLAADVFIYLGDLAATFAAVRRLLAAGGVFAFSVEALEGPGDWRLQPSGRYAQSEAYLRSLARSAGLAWRSASATRIRREQQGHAAGQLVLLENPG